MIAISTAAGSTGDIGLGIKLGIMKSSLTTPTRKRPIDTTVPILSAVAVSIRDVFIVISHSLKLHRRPLEMGDSGRTKPNR